MIKTLSIAAILLAFTCNTTDENQPTDEQLAEETTDEVVVEEIKKLSSEDADFLVFYQSFVSAVESKNAENVNVFIDEVFGVYFIESNGAMPNFKRVNDVAKFKSIRDEQFFSLNFNQLNQQPVFEELPKIICDATPYDKQGCFAQKINPFANDEFWYYTDLNEKEKQAISVFAEKIDFTVVNTTVGKFYFTKNGDSWKIGFIDLRVPCEA
ncbi:MAG: hypothetical protein KF732_03695 [Flavobacteriales bacterium]|nr:hypothetical protein [Flavobacteriales bacterium]MBX2959040.1 hypothetical protein [Flavobacteriales bacterium]